MLVGFEEEIAFFDERTCVRRNGRYRVEERIWVAAVILKLLFSKRTGRDDVPTVIQLIYALH